MVAGATNRQVFSLMAKPEIKRIADLRGKKIGITRVGSSTHTSALYALNSGGLRTTDYQLLPLLEVPNIFTALVAGQIDAGVVSPPTNARAKRAGFVELMKSPRKVRNLCLSRWARAGLISGRMKKLFGVSYVPMPRVCRYLKRINRRRSE